MFLQRDWHEQNYSSKSNQLNEAEESAEGHQTLFFLVRGQGLGTRLRTMGYPVPMDSAKILLLAIYRLH